MTLSFVTGKKIKNDSSSDAVAKDDAIEDDNDVIINQNQEVGVKAFV